MSILDKVNGHGCPYCAGKKVLVGFNDLLTSHQEIINNEWDWVKNESNNAHPTDFTRGSNKKAWFKCTKNHSYEMRIIEKIMKKQGCPYCTNKKVLKGFNDFESQYPDLMDEWDWVENNKNGIKPDEVTSGSNRIASWICNHCNGKYIMTVYHKVKGTCPFCSNRKLLTGLNDLQSKYPDLVNNEWDYAINDAHSIHPNEVIFKSKKKVFWKCVNPKNADDPHSYEMNIYDKIILHHNCPYCSGSKVLIGFNDLASQYPDLMSEWDWVENNKKGIKPDEVTSGSNRIASWICHNCHSKYEMTIVKRTNKRGCHYYAGRKVLIGFNDLQSNYPDIAKEWYQPMNGDVTPDMITKSCALITIKSPDDSNKTIKVKPAWKCSECGYIWKTTANSRTSMKTGCPDCAKHNTMHVSQQENEVADYMKEYLNANVNMQYTMSRSISFKQIYDDKHVNIDDSKPHLRMELDVYIPELSLAVEYDGDYWHNDEMVMRKTGHTNSEIHEIKHSLCEQVGIKLIFITEHDWLHDTDDVKGIIRKAIMRQLKS